MKEIERHDIEIPDQFTDHAPGVRLEFRRLEMQTGSDHIEIHIFQPDGAEQHRKSEFKVIDDDEGVVAFLRSNHNEPEPYQMALLGLGLEGFETRKNWELDHTERYQERAQMLQKMGVIMLDESTGMHPFDRHIFEQTASHLFIAGAVYDYHVTNDDENLGDVLDEVGAEAIEAIELAGSNEVKDLTQATIYQYIKDYLNSTGEFSDE